MLDKDKKVLREFYNSRVGRSYPETASIKFPKKMLMLMDLLVLNGYYGSRSEFVRTAVRREIDSMIDIVKILDPDGVVFDDNLQKKTLYEGYKKKAEVEKGET